MGLARSGGLARLKLNIVEKKNAEGGKVKSLLDVEKYLSGQAGVDVSETSVAKRTVAGQNKTNVLAAAKGVAAAQSSGALLADSRAQARAAAKAGKKNEEEEEDTSFTAAL